MFDHGHLEREEGNQGSSLEVQCVAPVFGWQEALYACLDGCVNDFDFFSESSSTKGGDNSIMACEGLDQACFTVVGLEDFDTSGVCARGFWAA